MRFITHIGPTKSVLLALASFVATSTSLTADDKKLAAELRKKTGTTQVQVVVQYVNPVTTNDKDQIVRHGGKTNGDLSVIKGLVVSLPVSQLADLSNDPAVRYISPDRPLSGQLTNSAPAVNAPYAWNLGFDGSGVGVAIIDSGIADKNDVLVKKSDLNKWGTASSRIVYSRSWVADGLGSYDAFGHGTHVAGIVAGSGYNSFALPSTSPFKGIAPNAQLINLRVLDSQGMGTESSVIAAIQTAIQLKSKYNIRVINLSLGHPVLESYELDPMCQAAEAAYRAGIVVVVAAGNEGRNNAAGTDGYATINSPANDPYVITVGAMKSMGTPVRADDLIATYSSKGPSAIDHVAKPDLVAPGNHVVAFVGGSGSTLANTYPNNFVPVAIRGISPYFSLSGTSMAAPMVSGAAALLLQANPKMTPDQVKALLMKTASKTFPRYSTYTDPSTGITYTSQYDVFTVGAGYLDIQAALTNAELSHGSSRSPIVAYDPATQSAYFVNDNFAVWGGSANWSTFAVWGGNVFTGSDFAVWGGSTNWSSFAVWGGSAAWGSSTNSGFFAVWGGSTVDGAASSTADSMNTLVSGEK